MFATGVGIIPHIAVARAGDRAQHSAPRVLPRAYRCDPSHS